MKKDILSIDHDDNNENYEAFTEYLEDDSQRKKKIIQSQIEKMGVQFLNEIDKKTKKKNIKRKTLIPYILKHCDELYDEEELMSYCYEDVQDIHNEIKTKNKSIFIKFIHFIFNI